MFRPPVCFKCQAVDIPPATVTKKNRETKGATSATTSDILLETAKNKRRSVTRAKKTDIRPLVWHVPNTGNS